MANKIDTIIECSDLTKYYRTPYPLNVLLRTPTGALGNKPITITIHGVTYNRTTKANGTASLDINLGPGTYTAVINFAGDDQYNASTKTVTVKVKSRDFSVNTPYLVKDYGADDALVITITELNTSTPVVGKEFSITIHGVTYNRTTDENGQGKLNINLLPDVYSYSVLVPSDEGSSAVTKTSTVKVMVDTFMDGTDIFKFDDETVVYQCAVYDPWGRVQTDVRLTVNGVEYIRHTDGEGLAKLNIRLGAGEYTLKAEFDGDELHHPSSVTNRIISKARMAPLTTTYGGLSIPGNNRGFMESHIYIGRWNADIDKQQDIRVLHPTFEDMSYYHDISFTNYEITETDPRVKTAKFTTDTYWDLTTGRHWVYITSPYHENFGGQILKVDYDKSTGLYTYQCQDGRRQYLSKIYMKPPAEMTVYQILETLLIQPNMRGAPFTPLTEAQRKNVANQRLLSGLHPLSDYDNLKSGAVKFDNKFNEKPGELLSYDSIIDDIMNLSHIGGFPTDVYFTPGGICHIDPINLDAWLKTGFYLTHTDLAQYKYGFDTTNVITNVFAKTSNGSGKWYSDAMGVQWYFGALWSMMDASTTTTSTDGGSSSGSSSNSSSSGANGYFVDMGKPHKFAVGVDRINDSSSDLALVNKVINALKAKGHTAYSLGRGDSVNQNHGLSSSAKGVINIFIVGGICAGTVKDYDDGFSRGYYHYDGMIMMFANCTTDNWISCKALQSKKQVRAHDDGFSSGIDTSITPHQMFEKHKNRMAYVAGQPNESFDSLVTKLVNGQFNCGSTGTSSSGTSTSTDSSASTTTVVDEVATYQKALDKMAESVRSLLSFEIKLPLNHTMFKELHTNQFLWTQLPREFKLGNLEKIFKILPTYKVNRGVSYVENRWYIEKIVTKMDSSGLFGTITLNPFPSSYSVYSNAVKGYLDAFNQAFRQQDTSSNSGTSTTNTGTGNAEQIFKEVAKICEQYSYSLGRGVSTYAGMKKAGHGDCWAFAELVYEELKARGVNTVIWTYATSEASNHRSSGYQATDGSWKDFPYRTYVTNPKKCVNGGNNWYFNFSRPAGASVIKKWTGGKAI